MWFWFLNLLLWYFILISFSQCWTILLAINSVIIILSSSIDNSICVVLRNLLLFVWYQPVTFFFCADIFVFDFIIKEWCYFSVMSHWVTFQMTASSWVSVHVDSAVPVGVSFCFPAGYPSQKLILCQIKCLGIVFPCKDPWTRDPLLELRPHSCRNLCSWNYNPPVWVLSWRWIWLIIFLPSALSHLWSTKIVLLIFMSFSLDNFLYL